jgi:heme/copper-type cytochrome/quinol oxidase subunit 1
MYIVVGVVGTAVSALFYYYIERVMGRDYSRHAIAKAMAWIHLLLMNVGTIAAMGMLMYAGYIGGAVMLPKIVGGSGLSAAQAHEILAPYVEPISVAILVLAGGVLAGGIGFLLAYKGKNKTMSKEESTLKRESDASA